VTARRFAGDANPNAHPNEFRCALRTPARIRSHLLPAPVIALLVLQACGTAEPIATETVARAAQSPSPIKRQHQKVRPTCSRAARDGVRIYRVCAFFGSARRESFIAVTTGSGRRRRVAGAPPSGRLTRAAGHWRDVWPSPDGTMLLAQWSGECEIPTAFFITLDDGSMRVVTHDRDWTRAPESEALGWTPAGLALVRLERGLCGAGASRPGVYAIDPAGGSTFLRP
jgi:hypothetical protein